MNQTSTPPTDFGALEEKSQYAIERFKKRRVDTKRSNRCVAKACLFEFDLFMRK